MADSRPCINLKDVMHRPRRSPDRFWRFNAASRVWRIPRPSTALEPRLPVSEPGQVSASRISVFERRWPGCVGCEDLIIPNTISAINGLALTYRGLGKRAESESMFLEALNAERRTVGPEHPDTLVTMDNLALMYTNEGRYRDAGPLYDDVLAIRRRVLGQEHPDTLLSMNNLGNLYSELGRYSDAEPLFAAALAGRRRVLGAEHPNTLNAMTNIAQLYFRQGRWMESETLFTRNPGDAPPRHEETSTRPRCSR